MEICIMIACSSKDFYVAKFAKSCPNDRVCGECILKILLLKLHLSSVQSP